MPGTLLAERYRIIGLLGKGGMGEVYRADDLQLGQPVALKLLPEKLDADEGRLKRFLGEVRTARQVSHNNVCRVYDVGETDGYHFLSMEYVDGEDLATLLKRIGRLPKDKAIEIARQICAGLAAAHDAGVLHRDLKPANIMIDGRGRAKITDFGLAGIADEIRGPEVRAGTPAYMAPEQLAGKEVSVRSDLYSLGLVLYELFTGKPAFEASSAEELQRLHNQSTLSAPSIIVEGFDPAVERVLLRCLDTQPARRPASALAVAAALPGGDPLAAALAAGETPSPEMVADAGEEGGLRPAVALGYLAFTLLGMGLVAILSGRASLLSLVPMDKPPQALVERARQIVDGLGYTEPPVDDAYGFGQDGEYLRHVKESDDSPSRWERMGAHRPSAVRFWYRQSPRPLVPINLSGQVFSNDPPFRISGMVNMTLSSQGDLMFFKAMPPHVDDSSAALEEPDWSTLFEEAGLDGADFDETPSTWNAENYCDQRVAWLGTYPDQEEPEVRVEACAYHGRVAFFDVIHPWDRPWRMQAFEPPAGQKAASIAGVILNFILILGACLLARRNLQAGRGDRKGAFRLAIVVVTTIMLSWLLRASHVSNPGNEQGMFFRFLGIALVNGVLLWLTYIALEPFVRRRWPESMVSWTRLMSGRIRDPLVGSHILLGAAMGILFALLYVVEQLVPSWLG
ncbi:MAG: serine/threonine-protein kinase, partial [Thermoanaerobaculia bacterium]